MAFTLTPVVAKDGNAALIGGGLLAADVAGGGAGPFFLFHGLVDGVAGVNKAQITAANALKVDGSGVTQPVSIASAVTVAQATAGNLNATVVGTGTFAVQAAATLAAETTKVIGTVRNFGNAGAVFDAATAAAVPANALYVGMNSSGNMVGLIGDATSGLWVNIKAGAGSGGTALADEAAFTEGTTNFTPIGGVFKTSQTALTSGQAGAVAMSAGREMFTIGKIWDGTNSVSVGTYGTAPGAVNALNVNASITNANANGSALQANSAPVTQAPTSFRVAVTPTVTASAYAAGNVLGGIMTFANILLGSPNASPTKWSAVLESIAIKFKAAAVTGEIDVAIFTASPGGGTYTDKTAPTANAADQAKLVGIYSLPTPMSNLGTMTVYNLDGIGAVIDGASTSLFAVVTVKGTPTPASTSDVIVELGVLQG